MAVTLGNLQSAVAALHGRTGLNLARARAEAECAALVNFVALAGHEVDDLVLADFIKLAGVRIFDAGNVTSKFNHRDLHAEADSEVGKTVLARVLRR